MHPTNWCGVLQPVPVSRMLCDRDPYLKTSILRRIKLQGMVGCTLPAAAEE